ncbi:hypothetical protein [Gilvimarinus polysaccharolyticus]|uniref:hypothetical protein n=1 Tax=Gilvimarinus polysaccharolyticus TaxID=863921 RepID=UPI0006734C52|nr:hypothetical protein [Gilvimarinus polysaccharolyticus]
MDKFFKVSVIVLLAVISGSGCYQLRRANTPMPAQLYCRALDYQLTNPQDCPRAADVMIMLPGIGDSVTRFEQEGLIDQLRAANLPLDALVADAHFGYYRSRTVQARLRQDVLAPAINAGYHKLHFAGVSLGGFGSLIYWRDNAQGRPASMTLLTPYLGDPEYYQYKLDPSTEPQQREAEKNLWPWLDTSSVAERGVWYLGLARSDKFYVPGRALGDMLPAANVIEVDGQHNWHAWRLMWPQLLQALQRDFYPQEPKP